MWVLFSNAAGPNTKGCYDPSLYPDLFILVDGEYVPDPDGLLADAVEITEEQHQQHISVRLRIDPETRIASEYVEPDSTLLLGAKSDQRKRITRARNAAISGGVNHAGYDWDTDDVSRGYLTGAVANVNAGIPLSEDFTWTTADDSDVPMDAAGLIALGAAVTRHVNTQHVKSRILKAQIEAVEIPAGGTIDDAVAALELITW
ncbi:DUF4376 domain-containing protein [uncultured Desulfuromusa sp.]|uniref:DUF4376 domain-containing protein n=1 Tax=uncultured Desulfuromusa sp. TaxID=219183 RepID=UPI002AA66D36|nr:DUF4376 domain-containing protein [uncultured Desulfuromusa sp.]